MNSTNLFGQLWSRTRLQVVFEFSIFFIINVVALLGNILVCWVFFSTQRLRTVTNIYIITLAVSDIIFTTLCLPILDGVLLSGKWLYPGWICKVHGFLVLLLCFVSLHTIALTGLNRYFRVVRPNIFKKIFTKKITIASVLVVVLVAAFLLAFPLINGWASLLFHPGKMACTMQFHNKYIDVAYSGFLAVVIVLGPFVTIIVSYQRVFKAVQIHKRTLFVSAVIEPQDNTADKLSAEEINITKTLFGIVLGFTICWAPVFVIEFVDSFRGSSNVLPRPVYLVYTFLVSVSAAVNPVLYGVLNKTFRKEYVRILHYCRKGNAVNDAPERTIQPNTVSRACPENQSVNGKSGLAKVGATSNLSPNIRPTLNRNQSSEIVIIPGSIVETVEMGKNNLFDD